MSFIVRLFKLVPVYLKGDKTSSLFCADVLITRHDADCGAEFDGQIYSPLADSVVDLLNKNNFTNVVIATAYSRNVGMKAYSNPKCFNRKFFWVALKGHFLKFFIGQDASVEYRYRNRVLVWKEILDKVKPRLIISVHPEPELCFAAKKHVIPVYDIQHGVIAVENWPYAKQLSKRLFSDSPTGILCWDDNSVRALSLWSNKNKVQAIMTGNPWYERFMNHDSRDLVVKSFVNSYEIAKCHKTTILVSLQWGLKDLYYKNTDFDGFICDALKKVILEFKDYNWLIRLHPVQLRGENFESCCQYLTIMTNNNSYIEWRKASAAPLPLLLSKVDLHITDCSSIVIEASWFGIPSALLNPLLSKGERYENSFKSERQSGLASLLTQDSSEIKNWIFNNASRKSEINEKLGKGRSFEEWLVSNIL